MDLLYIYRRNSPEEFELRCSLRSVERHLPYIGKVWIFGDRPNFLVDDRTIVEHVPQEYLAAVVTYRLPVVNLFLQIFLGSLIPNLVPEFLLFADDYVLLDFVPEDEMRKARALETLGDVYGHDRGACSLSSRERAGVRAATTSPASLWREALWRTCDLLARFGLPLYNFETHVPASLTKARVLEAFCVFRDFITEDRLYGPLALTAILNLAAKRGPADVVLLSEEKTRAGFYAPADLATIHAHCAGKKFLNFDEAGLNADMRRYLEEAFPEPSAYEADGPANPVSNDWAAFQRPLFTQQSKSLAHL